MKAYILAIEILTLDVKHLDAAFKAKTGTFHHNCDRHFLEPILLAFLYQHQIILLL